LHDFFARWETLLQRTKNKRLEPAAYLYKRQIFFFHLTAITYFYKKFLQ